MPVRAAGVAFPPLGGPTPSPSARILARRRPPCAAPGANVNPAPAPPVMMIALRDSVWLNNSVEPSSPSINPPGHGSGIGRGAQCTDGLRL